MTGVADEIDHDRTALAGLLTDAARFTTADTGDIDVRLRSLTDLLRTEADDLARRLRMVALGGPEINAGLAALEDLRNAWDVIDNKGDTDGNDGVVSRSDLEWAAENLDGDAARAARWLLDHPELFAAVETAKHNTDYLAEGGAGFAADSDETDGKLSLDDVDAYITKLDTWATLVPYMATIDVAAHGGELDGVMSKGDFEAFLDDQSLPPQVRQAAQTVLDDSAYHDTGGIDWDDVLMVASFIPVVGDFVDGAMALYYLSQGDWEQAALSGIGLLPIPGMTGGTVRGAKAAAEEAAEELAQRTARESIDAIPPSSFDDLGDGVYRSELGLVYGSDPKYPNRIAHVRAHGSDVADRTVPHGVFFDDPLEMTDAAWRIARGGGAIATTSGRRTSYFVDMGRPIGWIGGAPGAAFDNPPVRYIRLIIQDADEVITSYPVSGIPMGGPT